MNIESAVQGSLFARDFLTESISQLSDWQAVDDAALGEFEHALRSIFDPFPTDQTPNESQTEDDLIWPVLEALDWTASLRQQNLSSRVVGTTCRTVCFLPTRRPRAAPTATNRNGDVTSMAWPWSSPNVGNVRLTGAPTDRARRSRLQPRCCATCDGWTI